MSSKILSLSIFVFLAASSAFGGEGIKDNSFLIEEAYNQEQGVVQFIQGYQKSESTQDYSYSFTNEIPINSETHQISYVIPYNQINSQSVQESTGSGDILLNYRYQLIKTPTVALAPRFSLILPTGDVNKGLGTGATGFQFNQSLSVKLSDAWIQHWNMGFTFTPNAQDTLENKADLFGFNFGSSLVYAWSDKFNFLCEFVVTNSESVSGPGKKINETNYLILPGFRTAFDAGSETEIVPGIGFPLGLGPTAIDHEHGVFVNLSVESKLW